MDRIKLRDAIQTLIDNYDSTLPIDEACPHCKITEDIMLLIPDNKQAVKAEQELILKLIQEIKENCPRGMIVKRWVVTEENRIKQSLGEGEE